jgi:hypothetical protein
VSDKQKFGYFVSYMFQTNNGNGKDKRGYGDTCMRLDTDKLRITHVNQMRQHISTLLCKELQCQQNLSITILSFQRLPGEDGLFQIEGNTANTLIMRRS